MSVIDIERALLTQVALIDLTPDLPVAWPGLTFDPSVDGPAGYISVDILPSAPRQIDLGDAALNEYRGQAVVQVFSLRGIGHIKARDTAEQVALYFSRGEVLTFEDVTVQLTAAPFIAPSLSSGAYIQTPIRVAYMAHLANQ